MGKRGRSRGNGYTADQADRQPQTPETDWKLRYEAVVRAGRLMLYDWNLADGEVLYGGEVETNLGYPLHEMGNAAWAFSQIHPEDRPMVEEAVARIITTGQPEIVEYRVRRKDGEYVFVEDCAEIVPAAEGQSPRLVGFLSNVTKRRCAEEQLRRLNEGLEELVARRTAEAEQRAAQVQQLAEELARTEQRERQRFAKVLHDDLQQLLIAALIKVGILREDAPAELHRLVDDLHDLLNSCLQASRSLTLQLAPPLLYERGLGAGLNWLVHWVHDKYGLSVDLEVDEEAESSDESSNFLVFEIVRELLLNVIKHARVDRAEVRVGARGPGAVEVFVKDCGVGFDPAELHNGRRTAGGFGLMSIRQRLELVGGTLDVQSAPGTGTTAHVIVPIHSR